MSDPHLRASIDSVSARHVDRGAGASPDDAPFDAFPSEDGSPCDTAGYRPDSSSALVVIDVTEWCGEDDPVSLFSSEVPNPPRRIADDVRLAAATSNPAPVESFPRISARVGATRSVPEPPEAAVAAWARVGRRTFPVRATLVVLAFVVGIGGGAAVVAMIAYGRPGGGETQASVTPVAPSHATPRATAPIATAAPMATAVAPPEATSLPANEPPEAVVSSGKPIVTSPPIAPAAAAPAPLRQGNVERGDGQASVRPTSEPPRVTAAVPLSMARESAPAPTLPAITPRNITPEVAAASGAAAAPGIAATAGTPPLAETAAVASPSGPSSVVTATAVIESVLSRYAAAFTARDVAAARAVWPGLNERGLIRAFESVEEQRFDLGECVITATPPRAVASCDGTAEYVPKVGSKRVRSEPRHWTFRLEQQGAGWSIETVDLR